MRSSLLVTSLAVGLAIVAVTPLAAQDRGTIEGIVTAAESGRPLVGALVGVANSPFRVATVATGRYRLTDVPAGRVRIIARMIGRQVLERTVEVQAGQATVVDFALSEATVSLAEVVVTATRTEEELKDVPASVSVITARDIETKAHLYQGDELAGIPGIFVQKNDEGVWTGATIRGVPNRHHNDTFLALVDGVPMISADDEVQLEETVPLSLVDRVEVVKGPTSALYGRGGISGAVNYLTRSAFGSRRIEAGLVAGSYGAARPYVNGVIPIAPGRNHLLVSGFTERKSGWRDGTDRRVTSLFVKDQWLLAPGSQLSLYGTYLKFDQGVSSHLPVDSVGGLVNVAGGAAANYQIDRPNYFKRIVATTGVWEQRLGGGVSLKTTAHWRSNERDSNLGFNAGFDPGRETIDWNGFRGVADDRAFFVEPQLTATFRGGRIIAGASYERLQGDHDEFWTGEYGLNAAFEFLFYIQRRSYRTGDFLNRSAWVTDQLLDSRFTANVGAAYVQTDLDLGSRTTLTLGARLDAFKRSVDYARTISGTDTTPARTASDDDRRISPKVALLHRLSSGVSAFAAYGEGFSPAFGPVWAFGGREPTLRPELARNFEVGIKGVVADGRVAFTAAGYQLERRDLLQLVAGPGAVPQSVNAGKQRSRGIELETQVDWRGVVTGLTTGVGYSYTHSKWIDNRFVSDFTGQEFDYSGFRVQGVPAHQLNLTVGGRFSEAVRATVWSTVAGRYFTDAEERTTAPSVAIVNASVALAPSWARGTSLSLAATNLFDKRYFYYLGYGFGPAEAYPARPFELVATVRIAH